MSYKPGYGPKNPRQIEEEGNKKKKKKKDYYEQSNTEEKKGRFKQLKKMFEKPKGY